MNPKIEKFFQKNALSPEKIKYIIREDGKTAIYRIDDKVIYTYHTIKEFKEALPIDQFLCPNKGILAATAHVVGVKDGSYEMSDGRMFKYRVHNSPLHDTRLLMVGRKLEQSLPAEPVDTDTFSSRFSVLDQMPMAICIIELVIRTHNMGTDFIFRYCNQHMLEFEQKSKEEILGHSFPEVFEKVNPQWLVAYADVALNGTVHIIDDYSEKHHCQVRIYCYQPMPGHCACVLIPQSDQPDIKKGEPYSKVSIMDSDFFRR